MNFSLTRFLILALLVSISLPLVAQEETTVDSTASAVSLYNEGLTQLKAKEYATALPLFQQAIEVADPEVENDAKVIKLAQRNGAIAAYYVGNEYRKAKELDAALETYELGITYSPTLYVNYIGKAQTLDEQEAKVAAVDAYLDAAEICGQSEKTQDKVESLETKATNIVIRAYLDEDHELAIAGAEAFRAKKETADVLCYQAKALSDQGQQQEAAAAIAQAVSLLDQGGNADLCYFTKAEIHEALGQKEEAIAAYKKAKGKYEDAAKYKISELEQ